VLAFRSEAREDRTVKRRDFITLLGGAAAGATVLGAPSVHAQNRQTLRFAAQADLKILDPVWTTAYITRNHSYLVYDTLFGTDENLQVRPQMVDRIVVSPDAMRYIFTLRDSLRWHDGQRVLSEDCVESLKRWGKKNRFGQLLMAHTAKIAPVDERTFTLDLAGEELFVPAPKETPHGETGLHFDPHRAHCDMRERASPTATRRLGC
jgi:ABC-type transport system substrate-binding protein